MLNLDLEGEDFSDYGQEQPPVDSQQEYNMQSPIKVETELESDGYQSEFSNDIELDVCLEREAEVQNETEEKDREQGNGSVAVAEQKPDLRGEEKSPELPAQTSPVKAVLTEKNGRQGDQKKKKSNNKGGTTKAASHTQKSASKKKAQPQASFQHSKTIFVDTLVVGAGPAALGFVVNALKTGRLHDLIRSKDQGYGNNHGLAIIDDAMSFGGGQLGSYGINSNTSAGGFLKCMTRPGKKQNKKTKAGLALTAAGINQPPTACLNQLLKDITYSHKEKIEKISKSLQKQPQTQKMNSTKAAGLRKQADANKSKGTPVPDKDKLMPACEPEIEILGPFKDLNQSKIVRCMRENFGKQIIPLTVVGHFLNYVGNHLLFYINQLFSNQESTCKIFHPMHKAESIQLMQNGDCLVKVQKTDFVVLSNDDGASKAATAGKVFFKNLGASQVWVSETKETIYFRAKNIILANGGHQIVHPQFFNWFPSLGETPEKRESVITSDYFLKKEGYIQTMKKIGALKTSRKKKIVIVGGSHSGFSCAWLMLHQRPAQNTTSCYDRIFSDSKVPGSQRKYVYGCKTCCHCSGKPFNPEQSQKGLALSGTNAFGSSFNQPSQGRNTESMTQIQKPQMKCKSCICKCFGFFAFDDWKPDEEFQQFADFKPLDFDKDVEPITILHRDDIKVFYKRVADALADGYTNFKKSDFGNEQGYLYSFTGLRGDAKELYKNVADGKEKRLRFVQAKTVEEQSPYLVDADLIVWACGYQTKFIPIFDMGNTQQNQKANIPLKYSQKQPGTQFDVDNQCRVMLDNGVVLNKVHACGIAFPVRTNDGKTLGGQQQGTKALNPRADGFSLYLNIVGDILLKNLLPKDKKKALGHKCYPMIENRNALLNQSPLKILKDLKDQQPSNGNFALAKHAVGDIQSSCKHPTSDRFLVDHGKRLIKSNNSQSRQSKSQKRNTRMSQLHQIILSSEKEAPQPSGERMGEGLLNPQFMNTKDGCQKMKASHADLTTGEKLRSQHSSEYSQDNLAQLPLQNQQQEAQTMNMNPKPQFLCGQNFKLVQNPLIFVNNTQVGTFSGQAKCMQPLVSQTPLVLLKQKMLEEEQQLEHQERLNVESVSTQIDEQHGPNFPLKDTSEVNSHLQSQVAGQGQPNVAVLQGTLSKYIMNSKLVTQSPYVNEQLKRNISNIQKVQQRQHKKDKKDKRRSRLAHLSNGADEGGIGKLKEQAEIKHQQDEADTTITYDENLQSRTFKLQPEMEQIPTARIKLHEQFDKGQKKHQRMTSKLKHQNSNSDCYKQMSQSQKSQLTSNQVLYKKQNTLRHEKKSKEAGKSQVVKTLMSGGLLQSTKQQQQQHQVSQSSEALFPPIKNSHEQSMNDNEFYSRYSQKKGMNNVSQANGKMTREECIQKVVRNQESKLCKQRLLSSNMNLSTKAGLCVHSPRVSGLAFRSGGRNSTKIDEIDFRIKSKSPFLAANLGKMKQVDRLHSYGMLDDHSEPKHSQSSSFKKDVNVMKSDGDDPQLSAGALSEHQNHSVTPAEPKRENGLKHNVIVSSYFESLRNAQDSESDDQSKQLQVAQNGNDVPTPSTQEIEIVHKTPKKQKNGAKEAPSSILSPRLQPDLKKKAVGDNHKSQSKKHKLHQQSVNQLDQRHYFMKEGSGQKASLHRTVRKQDKKIEHASAGASGTSAISSSRGMNRNKSLSSEQVSVARLTSVHVDVIKKRNKQVKEASFGDSTVKEYSGQIKPLIMSNTIASGDALAEDSAMQTVVRCDSSDKDYEAPQRLNSQDFQSNIDGVAASDKTESKEADNQKHEPRELKTPSHSNFKEQRSPGSPHKTLQKCVLQEGLRSSGFSKLSGCSTSAVKHPKTIEASAHVHKHNVDLLTPVQKSKKQTAVNVLLKHKKRHFINKEYSPVLLKQGLHRTPTDVVQPRQLVPYGKPYKVQI